MKYFLSQDQSCHWYLIPEEWREVWDILCALDEDDPRCWEPPEWAKPIGGGPSSIVFENPIQK